MFSNTDLISRSGKKLQALGKHPVLDILSDKVHEQGVDHRQKVFLEKIRDACEDIGLLFEDLIWSGRMIEVSKRYRHPTVRFSYIIYNYNAFIMNFVSIQYRLKNLRSTLRKNKNKKLLTLRHDLILKNINLVEKVYRSSGFKEVLFRNLLTHERYFIERTGGKDPWNKMAIDMIVLPSNKDRFAALSKFERLILRRFVNILEKLHIRIYRLFNILAKDLVL